MPSRRKEDREEYRERRHKDVHIYKKHYYHHGEWGGAYFLGLIGALVYYLQHAVTGGEIIIGILKSLVWPAMVVYHVLGL